MERNPTPCSIALVAVVFLTACGSPTPDPDRDGGGSGADAGGTAMGPVAEGEAPDVFARAWCAHELGCDCNAEGEDFDACVARHTPAVDRRYQGWRDMGLVYDERCSERILREIDIRGCSAWSAIARLGCAACPLYRGSVARGAPCVQVSTGVASVCAEGLSCVTLPGATGFTCEDPCELPSVFVVAGEACDPMSGDIVCEPLESFCNTGGVCEAYPALGAPCPLGECSGDAYCDRDTGTCLARFDRGESCADGTQCNTGSCDEGSCTSYCWPEPFL